MGTFDWYKPASKIVCPACRHPLTVWQGKDGRCGLFVWVEGKPSPEDQRVDEEVAVTVDERSRARLPETFTIYSHDCPKHVVDADCRCENGTWIESTVQWPWRVPERVASRRAAPKTESVVLAYPGGCLRLAAREWCYVYLESGGDVRRLGAETRTEVIDGLLNALTGPVETDAVLSLVEDGTSLFVADRAGGRTLTVRDRSSRVATIELSEQLVDEWATTLARMRERQP